VTTKCSGNANSNANSNATGQSTGQTLRQMKDTRRSWLWWFLAIVAASQLYFVRELVAAFALFAIAFVAIAFVVASLYMLQKSWELAVARLAAFRRPVMNLARVTNMASVSNMARVSRENQKAA
jgi:small-conductance mechanosensitive channel